MNEKFMMVSRISLAAGTGLVLLLAQSGCGGASSVCPCAAPPPKGSISGRITDGGGSPLYGVQVEAAPIPGILSEGHPLSYTTQTTTDSDGRFRVEVWAGNYYIYSQPQTGALSYAFRFSSVVEFHDVSVPITGMDLQFSPAATGQIEGTISPAATGTRRYFVYLGQKLTLAGVDSGLIFRRTEALMESGSNRFHFPLLPEGEYTLNFEWSETGVSSFGGASMVVSLRAGETRTIQYRSPQ